ncbi:MAG TPA: NapC/NirT family cytochrome c, partial [Polyangiaceae bacterium]|nr:NapC/NirT family cytochrome c [Polyangiaceae bacterium]
GLMMIPVGWWLYRRKTGHTTRELLSKEFSDELLAPAPLGSRLFLIIAGLTLANIVFLGAGSARMLHFMDQPVFCGTACHSVMHPEWITYQQSPHARVRCVDCHVGQGPEAAVDAKLNGLWQVISVSFNLYERPIPTPVHNLRPARETCERCHWPQKFYGDRIKTIAHFADDRESSPQYTTLSLKVGSGTGQRRGEIHWHVAAENEVRYLPGDKRRNTVQWVEVRRPGGTWKRYTHTQLPVLSQGEQRPHGSKSVRAMDCVDCHNRATHIYQDPAAAVDDAIERGEIDRTIPFIRRQSVAALRGRYPSDVPATQSIEQDIVGYYAKHEPEVLHEHGRALSKAVEAIERIYSRNIHPTMNVWWNPYPSHIGHQKGLGCQRCHNPSMKDESGKALPYDCTLCHSILAYDSTTPFAFLGVVDRHSPQAAMHEYLRDEFVRSRSGPGVSAPELLPYPAPITGDEAPLETK